MADREKLIELLESLFVDYGAMAIFFTSGEAEVLADHLIANGVTVRERGRWERDQVEWCDPFVDSLPLWVDVMQCSVCKGYIEGSHGKNFCPHCGADMRGEEDGK